jgi:hypothetical protein
MIQIIQLWLRVKRQLQIECKVVNAATCNYTFSYCLYKEKKGSFANILLPGRRGWSVHTARAWQVSCGRLLSSNAYRWENDEAANHAFEKGRIKWRWPAILLLIVPTVCYPNELQKLVLPSLGSISLSKSLVGERDHLHYRRAGLLHVAVN